MRLRALFYSTLIIASLAAAKPSAAAGDIRPPDASDTDSAAVPTERFAIYEDIVGFFRGHVTQEREILIDIARRYDVGYVELRAANQGIDSWLPGVGRALTIPSAHILPRAKRKGIVINVPEMRLYYFWPDNLHVTTFPIGIGREGLETPLGETKIVRKRVKPTWRPTAEARASNPMLPAVVHPGPDNPLGEYALDLGWSLYMLHGTNKPPGVGRRVSRGCIRLYPEDIERLYAWVPVGTPVTVVNEPVKLGWKNNDLYLEVVPSLAQIDALEDRGTIEPEETPNLIDLVSMAAGRQTPRIDWTTVKKVARERTGIPVRITR